MKYKFIILFIFVITNGLFAKAPVFKVGRVYKSKSANGNFKLLVIPEKIKEPVYAIGIVKEKGKRFENYFFKFRYLEGDDYIISDNGQTVVQLKSYFKSENMKFLNGKLVSEDRIPVSKIHIYKNGVLLKNFSFDFVFYTYEDKTYFQKLTLDIDESKYLNLIGDTLYLISDTTIYKVNINDGKAMPTTEKVKLKSYKFKSKRLRDWHLRKYKKYDLLLKQSEDNVPHATF